MRDDASKVTVGIQSRGIPTGPPHVWVIATASSRGTTRRWRAPDASMGVCVAILVVGDWPIRSDTARPAAEEEASVCRARQIVHGETLRGQALALLPADLGPLRVSERCGEADERVDRGERAVQPGKARQVGLAGEHDRAPGAKLAAGRHESRAAPPKNAVTSVALVDDAAAALDGARQAAHEPAGMQAGAVGREKCPARVGHAHPLAASAIRPRAGSDRPVRAEPIGVRRREAPAVDARPWPGSASRPCGSARRWPLRCSTPPTSSTDAHIASMSAGGLRAVAFHEQARRDRELARAPAAVATRRAEADDLALDDGDAEPGIGAKQIVGGPRARSSRRRAPPRRRRRSAVASGAA